MQVKSILHLEYSQDVKLGTLSSILIVFDYCICNSVGLLSEKNIQLLLLPSPVLAQWLKRPDHFIKSIRLSGFLTGILLSFEGFPHLMRLEKKPRW